MLQQEDDLQIQPRGDSSKSPAPLRKVKKRTRDEVSFHLFYVYSIMNMHHVMKLLTTYVLLFITENNFIVFTPRIRKTMKDLPMNLNGQSEFKKIANFYLIADL